MYANRFAPGRYTRAALGALILGGASVAGAEPDDGLTPGSASQLPAVSAEEEGAFSDEEMEDLELMAGEIENIIINARKREETLQSVPMAVTAISGYELDNQNVVNVSDIQFKVPNMSFTKTNFTGTNLKLRGIGTDLTAASGDAGVEVNINYAPATSTRIFESEFYDLERVETLRGPQGTLFGRNATGGALNIYTKKPVDFHLSEGEYSYGNFNAHRIKGMVNIPATDWLRFRFAGLYHNREGFIQNLATGNDIDGRNNGSIRGSVQADLPFDITMDAMVQYLHEGSNRSRIGKQLCKKDRGSPLQTFPFSIGCSDDRPGFESVTSHATLGGILETYGLDAFADELAALTGNPKLTLNLYDLGVDISPDPVKNELMNFRVHDTILDPTYELDETFLVVELNKDIGSYSFASTTGYRDVSLFSEQDFNMAQTEVLYDPVAVASLAALSPNLSVGATANTICTSENLTAGNGPNNNCFDRSFAKDRSFTDSWTVSQEFRVASNYEGTFNFTAGASYLQFYSAGNYEVFFTGAEILAQLNQAIVNPNYNAALLGHFTSATNPYELWAAAVFGEAYWEPTDDLKVSAGLRYTHDDKKVRARSPFLNGQGLTQGQIDADPTLLPDGSPVWTEQAASWDEVTGMLTVDYDLDVDFTDETLLYARFSRGYKGGGFNPPVDPSEAAGISETFDPEYVWAYEVGAKNRFWDNRIQANLTGFFYDYQGYQVAKIQARTAINENVDAYIWGLEAEFLALFFDHLALNMSIAYLGTQIQEGESIDPANPSNDAPGYWNVKDPDTGSNVVTSNPSDPTNPAFWHPDGGFAVPLQGRRLPNTPDVQINVGAQYTLEVPALKGDVIPRIDYYWQNESYGRFFNSVRDEIDPWSQLNASLRYETERWGLFLEFWIKNALNSNDITGQFLTDANAGNFTNVFLLEPRTMGGTIGVAF